LTRRAVFLDRDGTITELVYYSEHGLVDSPCAPSQMALVEGAGEVLRSFKRMGYKLILVSNQPGIAKHHFTMETHRRMSAKMSRLLSVEGVELDGEYYCFHHPQAKLSGYRVTCDCRKPNPGMLVKAAREQGISLCDSVMIGDGLTDVMAGKSAGTTTILIGNINSFLNRLMSTLAVEPDFVARSFLDTVQFVKDCRARGRRHPIVTPDAVPATP
jgi:D-glycero-D-manno-heptose 1,7-bisphosphate phosphatase